MRRERRALDADEIGWLLATSEAGPEYHGLSGPLRALMYRLAVECGLRASELESLTRTSFTLNVGRPTVRVQAAHSKHRREDILPLRPETVAIIRPFLAVLLPGVPVFRGHKFPRHAEMIREDLAAARAAWLAEAKTPEEREEREKGDFLKDTDAAGRIVDLHALRHSFGSHLAAAGVHPKVCQSLMRHSTIELTMNRYSHVFDGQEAAAVAKLPRFAKPTQAGRKTAAE